MAGISDDQGAFNVVGKRNVVVVGKSGAGKSTVANKIIREDRGEDGLFEVGDELEAVTTQVDNKKRMVNISGSLYKINMIDTVGLRDPGCRRDSQIIKEIKTELRKKAPDGLNLIVFVYKHGRFAKDEQKVFKKISDNFADMIEDLSLLVITNCERMKPEAREEIAKRFRENPLTAKFGTMMKKGIYCVGFPDAKYITEQESPTLKEEMENDIKPIHKVIAEAIEMHLQDEIQKKSGACIIL